MDDLAKNTLRRMERAGWSSRRGVLLLLLAALVLPAASVAGGNRKPASPGAASAAAAGDRDRVVAEEKLGIEVVAVRLSEAGSVLDLRYRVVDPAKAHACLSTHARPYLLDVASGAKLGVPDMAYVGALRQTAVEPLAGKVYFMIFWNPGQAVKAGQKVNLVVGDQTVAGLVVS